MQTFLYAYSCCMGVKFARRRTLCSSGPRQNRLLTNPSPSLCQEKLSTLVVLKSRWWRQQRRHSAMTKYMERLWLVRLCSLAGPNFFTGRRWWTTLGLLSSSGTSCRGQPTILKIIDPSLARSQTTQSKDLYICTGEISVPHCLSKDVREFNNVYQYTQRSKCIELVLICLYTSWIRLTFFSYVTFFLKRVMLCIVTALHDCKRFFPGNNKRILLGYFNNQLEHYRINVI